MITKGNTVAVHYTGKLSDGNVFDSSVGKQPLSFEVGTQQVIAGFEDAVLGKNVGDKVTVNISPENGYGIIREDLYLTVPIDQMPGEVEVGQSLQAMSGSNIVNVTVKEINEDHVIIDGNHPLAGKELTFVIEVIDVY